MPRGLDRRLGRLAGRQAARDRARDMPAAEHRSRLRCQVKLAEALRRVVPPAMTGPCLETALRAGEAAAAELAAIPDTPALQAADRTLCAGPADPGTREKLLARLDALIRSYSDGHMIEAARASPMEWVVWGALRRARARAEDGDAAPPATETA